MDDLEIREINPPQLFVEHLGQRILCYRPMRHGAPNMAIESLNGKTIINNYGHGGSGWTLAPGAAKYVVGLMDKNFATKKSNKDTPIVVIGAGVIGLLTCLELINQGYTNITIYADKFDDLTSHNAGGMLSPGSVTMIPELKNIMHNICIESYKFYKHIALKLNQQIPSGAIIMPTYFATREASNFEVYVGTVMQPAKDVLVDFKNGTTHQMVVYDEGIFMDTEVLMHSFTHILKNLNVSFVKKKINNFFELEENIIFNCTGLGAQQLSKDALVTSTQGHLIMLNRQNLQDVNYMMLVSFDTNKTLNGQEMRRSFYFIPKRHPGMQSGDVGVIGGTYVENTDISTPNNEEFDMMLQAAKRFYGLEISV